MLITAGVYFGDAGMSALVLLYCWVALYAGQFHRRPWAVLQLGLIGVAYGVALAARGGGPVSILHWVVAMGTLAVVAAVVGSLRHRLEGLVVRLGETARTDALTGLLNRRGFLERLETQLESARRGESPRAWSSATSTASSALTIASATRRATRRSGVPARSSGMSRVASTWPGASGARSSP